MSAIILIKNKPFPPLSSVQVSESFQVWLRANWRVLYFTAASYAIGLSRFMLPATDDSVGHLC